MPRIAKLATGALVALVVAHDIHTRARNRQIHHFAKNVVEANEILVGANDILLEECKKAQHRTDWLIHVLDENGIAPDEFDLIALNYHNE